MKSYMNCRIVFRNEEEFTYRDSTSDHGIEGSVLARDVRKLTMVKFHQWVSEFDAKLTPANSRLPWEIFGYHIYEFLFGENTKQKEAFEALVDRFLEEKKKCEAHMDTNVLSLECYCRHTWQLVQSAGASTPPQTMRTRSQYHFQQRIETSFNSDCFRANGINFRQMLKYFNSRKKY